MKLLIQLVREILHLSGKSQGISNTYGCGNHANRSTGNTPTAIKSSVPKATQCVSGFQLKKS